MPAVKKRAPRSRVPREPIAPASCPRFTFKVGRHPGASASNRIHVQAFVGKRRIGELTTELPWATADGGAIVPVGWSGIDEEYRRCGLGTQLYERAAKAACKVGATLASDNYRSVFSQAFWEKQVRKGRAECMGPALKDRISERATRLADHPAYGRGGCERYRLTRCPSGSLSGRR